jgi:hypothetical protein
MAKKLDEPAGRAEVFASDQLTAARLAGDAFLGWPPHLQTSQFSMVPQMSVANS